MTRFVSAEELHDERLPIPLFIEDGVEAAQPGTGIRTSMARMVSAVHFETKRVEDENGEAQVQKQVVVDFADGTPSRSFDPNDIVEIRRILPGVDLYEQLRTTVDRDPLQKWIQARVSVPTAPGHGADDGLAGVTEVIGQRLMDQPTRFTSPCIQRQETEQLRAATTTRWPCCASAMCRRSGRPRCRLPPPDQPGRATTRSAPTCAADAASFQWRRPRRFAQQYVEEQVRRADTPVASVPWKALRALSKLFAARWPTATRWPWRWWCSAIRQRQRATISATTTPNSTRRPASLTAHRHDDGGGAAGVSAELLAVGEGLQGG